MVERFGKHGVQHMVSWMRASRSVGFVLLASLTQLFHSLHSAASWHSVLAKSLGSLTVGVWRLDLEGINNNEVLLSAENSVPLRA